MSLPPGARLGPYEVLAPLGAGGMGEVYRAKDTRLDRDIAIKVLPAQSVGDAQAESRFDREAHARGMLHRDLKPANLFLTSRQIKILHRFVAANSLRPSLDGRGLAITRTTTLSDMVLIKGIR